MERMLIENKIQVNKCVCGTSDLNVLTVIKDKLNRIFNIEPISTGVTTNYYIQCNKCRRKTELNSSVRSAIIEWNDKRD